MSIYGALSDRYLVALTLIYVITVWWHNGMCNRETFC